MDIRAFVAQVLGITQYIVSYDISLNFSRMAIFQKIVIL